MTCRINTYADIGLFVSQAFSAVLIIFCLASGADQKLAVFHAGSLSMPVREMATQFKKEHPDVEIVCEAAGSRDCARKISDLGRTCDLLLLADYEVIDQLLVPKFAAWNIIFAGNEMCIVYTKNSRRSIEITEKNWFSIMQDPAVAFGRSEPNADPCGYRTVLLFKLAETVYGQPGLAAKLLVKDRQFIRPKETDLLALLETNSIDYLFIYRSVAVQHNLPFVTLPASINLSDPARAAAYGAVSVPLSGKTPGDTIIQRGAPISYGMTIPTTAPNPVLARAFAAFILDPQKGGKILQAQGQPPVTPAISSNYDAVPAEIRSFVKKSAPK